jgi:hypothetical protein
MLNKIFNELGIPQATLGNDGREVNTQEKWRLRREEILDLLKREMYGDTPSPCPVEGKVLKDDPNAYSAKAAERSVEIRLDTPGGIFAFPVTLVIPKTQPPRGIFVNIAFMITSVDGALHCPSCPIEEIIDAGFALAIFDYLSVVSDDGNPRNGIAPLFPRLPGSGWGRLGMWAYGMSRVADYLKTLKELQSLPFAAIGFSRLGKTVLWCGAQDERFDFVMPFGSSTAGLAFTRKNSKQSMEELQFHHGHWFCENFRKYNHNEAAMPFDQHFVAAVCAPRRLLTAIAEEDEWIDVEKEFLSCKAASVAYRIAGGTGFIAPDVFPHAPAAFMEGDIAMHLRHGTHFFSRNDWQAGMRYIDSYLETARVGSA